MSNLDKLQQQILKALFEGTSPVPLSYQKAYEVASQFNEGLFEGWGGRRLNIAYNASDNTALAAMEYNLFHFSHSREKASVIYLNQLLIDKEKNNIRSFADFRKLAQPHVTMLNEHWLNAEYKHAVSVGQNASAYHKHLSDIDDIPYIQYQTAGDSNVRAEHAKLDGLIFRLDDKEARKLYPPNGWGCRCEMIQYIGQPKNVTSGSDAIGYIPVRDVKNFAVNRGDTGEVFTRNQEYIQDKKWADSIDKLTFKDYGLKPFKDMEALTGLKLDKTITPANVSELFKPAKGTTIMPFKDYLNRNLTLTETTFKKHLTAKYLNNDELRHQLFPHIAEVINKPNEVYMTEYKPKRYNIRYIKFYEDNILVVDTDISNKLEVQTWYMAKGTDVNHVRKGLIIKK